jgi:hypothetical protein
MTIDRWQDFLNEFTDEQLAALVREQELGSMNFSEAVRKLTVIRDLVAALSQEDQDELPSSLPNEVDQYVEQAKQFVQQMRDFTLAQDQSNTQHQNILNGLEGVRQWFATGVRPHLRGRVVDVSSKVTEIDAAHDEATKAAGEVDRLLKQIRLGAGEVGANELAGYYEKQAKDHEKSADGFVQVAHRGDRCRGASRADWVRACPDSDRDRREQRRTLGGVHPGSCDSARAAWHR